MKNFKQIITVVALAMFMLSSFDGNAQSKEEKSSKLYESTMNFIVENAKPFYSKGMSKSEFISNTLGSTSSVEINSLMSDVYNSIKLNKPINSKTLENIVNSNKSAETLINGTSKRRCGFFCRLLIRILEFLIEEITMI